MIFKPRKIVPSNDNKYYTHIKSGGWNPCLEIEDGMCFPNCVGYGFGRVYEIMGIRPNLTTYDAENWWYQNDGYKRGQTPKLGAIACWEKGKPFNGKDGYGHIAIVEAINGDVVTFSNSAYLGKKFYLTEMKPPYNLGKDYKFLGFIYLPITFDEYSVGDYRVIDGVLRVRTGASTEHRKLTYDELTDNAKEQIFKLVGYECNGYPEGVECTVSKVIGNWGKTPSGWICLDYCEKI